MLVVCGAALLLGACEVNVRSDAGGGETEAGNSSGQVSINAPGFGLNMNLPAALKAQIGGDGQLIFPGASMSGLNVNAGAAGGNVQLSFATPAAVQEVLAWYQDPARAIAMTGLSVQQTADGYRISGRAADGGGPFTLQLSPGAGGGTQGQLNLSDQR
jgi:hypothetical protein